MPKGTINSKRSLSHLNLHIIKENNGVDEKNSGSSPYEDVDDTSPDDVIQHIGGCGKFQFILASTIQVMKLVVCWGMIGNTFLAFVPEWDCLKERRYSNWSLINGTNQPTFLTVENATGLTDKQKCAEHCSSYRFHGRLHTLVNEVSLKSDLRLVA